MKQTAKAQFIPFKVFSKPDGFSVDRFVNGKIQRWGRYETRGLAELMLPTANEFARHEAKELAAGGRALHLSPIKEAA